MTTEQLVASGLQLPLMEAFYTIQGEGQFSGHAAYFIRLGGCDVGCVWCDVKESWEAGKWPILPIEKIVSDALSYPGRLVVITGGEPLLYDLGPLTQLLKSFWSCAHKAHRDLMNTTISVTKPLQTPASVGEAIH